MMPLDRSWFIQSRTGNIKDQYFFEKKLGSGGYGAVYLALNKQTGEKVAVKAMQKGKIQDYESFKNEINILHGLVSFLYTDMSSRIDGLPAIIFSNIRLFRTFRITRISSNCMKRGKQSAFVSLSQSKCFALPPL